MFKVETLPFKMAIRTVMNDVWYSNALPEWYTPERIDESRRVIRLRERANSYLDGEPPLPALSLPLPRLTGGTRRWVVPAVNDQMLMHACVSNISHIVAKRLDRRRVFSCEPNDSPNRVAFMKPQIAAMMEFHNETVRRLEQGAFVLELDIEQAFASIDRANFFAFLDSIKPDSVEVRLIRRLIETWAGTEPGIPLVNDSVFFLGNAYLSVVDRVVANETDLFIRYLDDYRIFGSRQVELERVFEQISRGLAALGLRVNPRKVRIGSRKDFLQPVNNLAFASKPRYVIDLDVGIYNQIEPEQLADLVSRSLETPDEYLNEGFGRYLLGALRRYRLNLAVYRRAGHEAEGLGVQLRERLAGDGKAAQLTAARLGEYGTDPRYTWRAIWVLYLIEQQGTASRFQKQLARIEQARQMPEVVRLWSRRCRMGLGGEPEQLGDESLHDMSYLEAGRRCYGEHPCKGEGF